MANWWDEFYSTKPDKPRSPGLEPAPAAPLAGLSSVAPSSSFAERVNQLGGPSPFAGIDYTAAPPAPALPMPPKPQPAFDLGNTASALWEGATQQLVPGVKSALAQAYTGLDRPDANPEWATRWMSEGRAAQQQADARTEELRKAGQLDSTSEAIRQAIPSLGFSGVTMLGSVPAGIGAGVLAGAASANPIVGGVAGATAAGAAGGALGYRMAGSQFMNDSFAQLEEESQKRRGRGLTDQEKQQAYDALLPVAQNTGLWEAGPEAVGNAAMFGLGKIALGILPKDAMAKLASSTLGKIGVRAGAGAGALGTEVATEGVTQFVQGNDQQRGQAITEALLSGKDPNEAAAAAVPQYQGAAGLWQATKDVAPATIATVLLMGGIAKPAHMVGSAIQNRREGNAAVSNAETATADLRANLDFAREGDILTALQGYDAIEQERTLPKAARERLDGARRQLLDELQLRASPAALNESLDTARGATGYLGFAQRTNELDDAAVQEAAERPLADDAAPALLEARKAYQQEWQSRQELNQAAAHFEQNPGAVEGVAKVLGNLAAGKPMTKGAHGSVDYNLASLADEQAIRYRNAGRVLLRDHADALGKLAAPVKNAVELLDEEISNRSTGQRRDPQAIREADVAARIAKVGDKYMATLLKGLSVDALERMASGLESRAGLEPDLAAKVATIRALADARKTEATPPPAPQPAQPPVNPPAPAAPAAPKSREALAAEVAALNQNRLPTPPQAPVPAVPEPALPQPAPALPGPVVPNVQNPTEMGQRMLAEALARQQAVRGQQAPALPTPSGTKELARLLGPRPTPQTIQAPPQAPTPDLLSGPARLGIVPSGGFAQGPLALPQPGANRNAENVRVDQGPSGQGRQEGQPGLRRGPVESGGDLRGAGQNRQGPQPTRQGAASEVAAREPSPPAETVAAPPAKPPVELPAGPERTGRGGTEGAGTPEIPPDIIQHADALLAPVVEAQRAIQTARNAYGESSGRAGDTWTDFRAKVIDAYAKMGKVLDSIPDPANREALRRYFADRIPDSFVNANESAFRGERTANVPPPAWAKNPVPSTQPETRREERQAEAQANAEAKAQPLLKQEPPASKGAESPSKETAKPAEPEKPTAPQPEPQSATASKPASYGKANKIFTEDAANAARERLRKKLAQLNVGIDPEMIQDGITLAGYHLEAGARAFSDYARAMLSDLGDQARPYLRSWYEGARHFPGFDKTGMTKADHLDASEQYDVWPGDAWTVRGQSKTIEAVDTSNIRWSDGTATPLSNWQGMKKDGATRTARIGETTNEPATDRTQQPGMEGVDQGGSETDRGGRKQSPAEPEGDRGNDGRMAGQSPENVATPERGNTGETTGRRPTGSVSRGNEQAAEGGNAAAGRARAGDGGLDAAGVGERRDDGGVIDPAPVTTYPNYHITNPKALVGGTPKARFAKNKRALETYLELKKSGLQPTPEQLDAMAAYIGWGSFGQELFQGSWNFSRPKPDWVNENLWLRNHLGKDAWESAQASILNAHYTDPPTVSAIWNIARKLGFEGGRVLEPSMGVGNFFGLMPRDLMAASQLTGIELDETTAGIAKLLYPDAVVRQMGYQDSQTADNFYDLIVGNWPFAKHGPMDRRYMKLSPSLHDYFFLKALDQVRPGGLVIGITSRFTMDKKGQAIRREMARKAELVASFRLPTGAFDEYAGTNVVTDVIILKKRASPVSSPSDPWIELRETTVNDWNKVEYNQYYHDNPTHVLGETSFGRGTTTGVPGLIVVRPADFAARLDSIADRLPERVYEPRTTQEVTRYLTDESKDRQQSATIGKDGHLYQVQGERLARLEDVYPWAVKDARKTAEREAQIRALVQLRKNAGALFSAERDPSVGDDKIAALRAALKKNYQAFVANYGPINDSFGIDYLKKLHDPYYVELAALESRDGDSWRPALALERTTTRGKQKTNVASIADALVVARNERMDFDMSRVAELANTTPERAAKNLIESGAVFETPDGTYVVADQYLSGNVRRKLREAKAAMDEGKPGMARNVAALEKVIPKDVPYYNIEARMGASWIPVDVYRDFVREILNVPNDVFGPVIRTVGGNWKVDQSAIFNRAETDKWEAPGLEFRRALSAALNVRTVTIKSRDDDGTLVVDEEATKVANQKIAELREAFANWVWATPDRQVALERTYNEIMNAMATPAFDGSFLALEGMALKKGDDSFSLRKHQVDAIYRGIVNRRGLYAHEVGTGKTYTIAGVAMESRRYGIARKPLVFAHNANSKAVAAGIKEMYPNAKVLYIDNLSPDTIEVKLRQIKMDDWDAVVVPHSLIERFALSKDTLMDLAKEEIEAMEEEAYSAGQDDGVPEDVMAAALAGDDDSFKKIRSQTAKDLVRARNQIIASIEKQALRASKENAVTFEELGVDQIIVDEAHIFKKPPISTRMTLRGLNKTASARSIALNFLAGYVKKINGGTGVHLFTGTPITNTLTETYHMMRYIMDDEMKRDGLSNWDTWFNSFASETNDIEITSSGEYMPVTRLATFINVADLRRMMGTYTDIVFADDMPEFLPRQTESGKTMADELTAKERDELENGRSENAIGRPYKKVIVDSAEMTPEQASIMSLLVERAKKFRDASRKERKEIMLSGSPESPILVETDASNAGLDQRLFKDAKRQVYANGSSDSKAARAVKNILKHYREHPLATQAVFMDRGFDKTGFNLAKSIVDDLVKNGVPRKEIAIVSGETSDERRAAIADAMNRAEIRIVIGNTQTLGVGVNMQRNLRALHHLDAPWTPADLEQRNGRGHRQGNQWNTVLEYRYLTERLDGRRWQVLAVKDRFIKSFLKADANVRVIEGDAVDDSESGDIVATLSEAAGDPRILVVKKLKADIEKLQSRERLHGQAVVQAKDRIEKIERQIGLSEIDAGRFDADYAVYEASRKENSGFIGTLDGKTFDKRDDMQAAFEEFIKNKIEKTDWEPKPFGELNGLTLWYIWGGYSNIKPDYYVGKTIRRSTATPSISALQAIASRFDEYADSERKEAAEKKDSIAGLKKQSEEKFGRADELKHKQEQLARVELDMQVNPVPPPTWLRNGAPLHSIAYLDGTPYVVTGHRWTDTAYLVELQSEDGKTQKSASYDDLTDHQGIALYEPHPFVAPDLPTPSPADAIALDANDAQQTAERSGVVSVPLKIARTSPIKALGKIVAKKDVRVFTNYVYTDENNIVATDGHHLVAIPNDGITKGYYDPKTEESVSIDIRYPDYEKVIPKNSDAKTTVEGVSLDALIGLVNGAKKTTAAKNAANKKSSKKIDGVPIHLNDGQATGVYNAELLLNALVAIKAATGADTVTVRTYVRDKGSPQIKISDPTSGARAVVMVMSNIQGDLVSVDVRNAANVRRSAPNAPTLQPATIAQARTALARAVGADFVASMEKAGKLVFHDSDPTGTGAAGFVDPKGVVHLIPANMDQSAASVLAHEAIHLARDDRFAEGDRNRIRMAHAVLGAVGLKNFIGNPGFTDLAQQVRRMAAEGNKTAQDALAKAKLEAPYNVDEEAVAYLAQYADEKLPLVRRILSAIRAALYRMGIKVALTPADVRALALSALKARAKMEINREARLERLQKLEETYVEKHGPAAVGMRRVELLRSLPETATLADFERLQERALRASQATTEADAAEQERLWQEFQAIRAQFQAKEAMKTPFRRWFGEGVEGVTARDGKPITLYHGTNNPTFTKWDASRAGQATRQPTAGLGFFMTADKGAAYRFGSNLLELNAKIDKPYYLTDADLWAIDSVEAATKLRAKLQAQGYDGAVLAEPGMAPYVIVFNSNQAKFVTNENPTDNEDFRYSIPGRPARIDTPRVAAKVMNDIGGVRDALKPGESLRAKADPRNWAQMLSDLKSNARPAWLGLLTRNMQLELAREVLPRGAVTQFDEAAEAMDAYESRMIQSEGFPLAERWQNLMLKAPAQADRLSQLLYLSTWTGVDPRKPAEKGKEAAWTRAKAAFDAMADPNARALYGDVLAFYGQQTKRLFDELQARIDRTALPEKERRAAGDVLRKEFERMKQDGPYVPLMRFGDLTVFAEPRREGEKPVFATFETVQDQRAFADWLKREGYAPKLGVKADEIAKRALPAGDMVEKLAAIVDQTTKGPQAQVLKDAMYQLFLRSLPEQSIRKHFIHRRYVPGYSADALRTFATFARRSAKQIARLAHSDRLSEALDDMTAAAKTGDLAEPVAAGHLVNELDKTFQWIMNPTTNAVSSRLTHLGFMWHLGASPAHFFLNLSQQAQVTFPWLAGELHGKIGAGRIAAALAKANRDFLLSNPFVAPTKRGPTAVRRRSLLESEFGGDMGRALQALEEAGKTDKTQTYSLAGLSEEDSWLWSRPYLRKFTQGATWFFHTAEVINREATAIAAYRLARNAGMGHEAAYDLARRAINETHFDYSPSNRARFMRGNVAKVLTLFKQYSLNVSWQLARNLYLMSRGASPEVKAQARTKLLGMLGMTALMAGAAGLPLYGELMWLITQALNAGRDDDEPEWDADAELRELLNRAVGQPWSMAARKGLMNAFLGIDVSSRVKLDDLWWRSDERDLEGKQLAYSMMEQALGPVAGLFVRGVSTVDGLYESLVTGENARGASWKSVEGALPKTLKDISRSIRYAREGATTQQGATVMPADRFTTANEVGQALGFTPAELAERYAVNRSMKNLEQHIVRRRQALLDMMAMALRQGDEEAKEALIEDVKAFNRRYPTVAITGETLRQSLQAKARALTATEAAGGVSLNRNLIPLLAGKGE